MEGISDRYRTGYLPSTPVQTKRVNNDYDDNNNSSNDNTCVICIIFNLR
jgi:hypothetical protein